MKVIEKKNGTPKLLRDLGLDFSLYRKKTKIFNWVFTFFDKYLFNIIIYTEWSAGNFDAESSTCFLENFIRKELSSRLTTIFLVFLYLLHAQSFTRFQGIMRNERTFSVIPCKNLADLQRIIQQTTLWGRWRIPAFSQIRLYFKLFIYFD